MNPRNTVSTLALSLAFFALATPTQAQNPGVTVDDSGAIVPAGTAGGASRPAAQSSTGQIDVQPGPIPGVNGLLNSLDDLDRPLSAEEITAYGVTLQQQIPLSPELIRDYRRRLNESERAAAAPPTGQRPAALSKAIRVSLNASGPTPQVYTSPGTVSVVSFFDRTGAPWPVASFVIGRENKFQVYAMQEGSNQLAIAPLVTHGYSNLAITLVEEDQPLVIDLETNEQSTHYRLDMSLDGLGPNAEAPIVQARDPRSTASDDIMMAFVQGAGIPNNAVPLGTDDGDVAAWSYGDDLYIRTNQTLISPSWSATLSGPGGIKAYRLRPAPVALITRNGRVTRVRISQ